MLDRVFTALQEEEIIRLRVEALGLDSTIAQVHPDGTGAEKKRPAVHRALTRGMEHQNSSGFPGSSRSADLLPLVGQYYDTPAGRRLLRTLPLPEEPYRRR